MLNMFNIEIIPPRLNHTTFKAFTGAFIGGKWYFTSGKVGGKVVGIHLKFWFRSGGKIKQCYGLLLRKYYFERVNFFFLPEFICIQSNMYKFQVQPAGKK